MKRFSPIMIGLLHGVFSFLILVLVISSDPSVIFSSGYAWVFVLIPGVCVPAGIVLHRILKKNHAWWIVGLGCVISFATTVMHIVLIVSGSAVV